MRGNAAAPIAALAMAAVCATSPVLAETLNLMCKVEWTRPGGHHRPARRRLEINLDARTVKTWDDVGQGFTLKSEHPIVRADHDRIVLEESGGKDAFIDRRSGEYRFKNEKEGLKIEGPCGKIAPGKDVF